MIQRKQTLFLLQMLLFSVAMFFVPHQQIYTKIKLTNVYLLPSANFSSTKAHYLTIAINFVGIIITLLTIFLYKKRKLQVKLCYVLIFIWLVICSIIVLYPFVVITNQIIEIKTTYFGYLSTAFAIIAALLAIVFIKKDIELLKSADRIR
jgi:hypothetical protein